MTNRKPAVRTALATRVVATMALLLGWAVTLGQQTAVPGASALDAEKTEEIPRYSVELIIFEYTDQASAGSEIFDPDESGYDVPSEDSYYFGDRPAVQLAEIDSGTAANGSAGSGLGDDTADLLPPSEDTQLREIPTQESAGLKVLGPEDYQLNEAYGRLQRLDAYRPLMRTAWVQQTLEKELAVPIKLRRLGDPPLRLDGTVTLYLSRFLHLVVDLAIEEKSPQRMVPADRRVRGAGDERSRFSFNPAYITPSTFYRIDEDRIVRNGELRYYDHPRFGVLAKITRIETNTGTGESAF